MAIVAAAGCQTADEIVAVSGRYRGGGPGSCRQPWTKPTIGANLAHGIGDGPIGALVSAWPALVVVGSFELLLTPWRMAWDVRSATGLIPTVGEPERGCPEISSRALGLSSR